MTFLNKIDNLYSASRKFFGIPQENSEFSCYIPIETVGYESSCGFVIKKQEKAKLLLVEGKQRVHISDLQILHIILNMDKEDIEWFLQRFIGLYMGQVYPIQFKLDGQIFEGHGIEPYPNKKNLHLFSDSVIHINDFVFILNFIFSKDKCWEDMKELQDFSKRTLCKYITLIDYYANATTRSKAFLTDIGYPVEKKHPIDSRQTKKLFNHTEKFDICLYK